MDCIIQYHSLNWTRLIILTRSDTLKGQYEEVEGVKTGISKKDLVGLVGVLA